MDKKPTIFDYLSQVFTVFGITVVLLNIFCLLFGESAKEFSTIFSLGSAGLSVKTIFQFLLAIGITDVLRFLFMTDMLIKKMPLGVRVFFLFLAVFISIVIFIVVCNWFPTNNLATWAMFVISFAVSCTVSTLISMLNERAENRRLTEALNKYKEKADE